MKGLHGRNNRIGLLRKFYYFHLRRLIREEGMLCGGSSGASVSVAIKAAASLEAGKKCVIILPDSVRNYMTKFLSDKWLAERDIIQLDDEERLW